MPNEFVFNAKAAFIFAKQHIDELGTALEELDYYTDTDNEDLKKAIEYLLYCYGEFHDKGMEYLNGVAESLESVEQLLEAEDEV